MGSELMNTSSASAVSVLQRHGLGDVLQPMMREIHLFDTYIAGTTHPEDPSVLRDLRINDSLILQREDQGYDQNAIRVLTADRKKIGYVPEKDNMVFARLMDAGKILKAKITDIGTKEEFFTFIRISICLVDL